MSIRPLPFPYIPPYIDGELLLSWIIRIHTLNNISDPRFTLAVLFGSATGIPSADLPCRLQKFIAATESWGPFKTVAAAATASSLFPYFTRFLDPQRYHGVLAALSGARANGLKLGIGLVANRFGASAYLRSCPDCDAKSLQQNGCYVLYRIHQLPGVSVCTLHGRSLRLHGLQSLQSNRQALREPLRGDHPINRVNGDIVTLDPAYSCSGASLNQVSERFAFLSREALEAASLPIPFELRSNTYLNQLRRRGLASGQKVDWAALNLEILAEYDDFRALEFRERLMSTPRHPLRWLKDLITRPERALHPICHLLLIGLLFKDLKSFLAATCDLSAKGTDTTLKRSTPNAPAPSAQDSLASLLADTEISCRSIAQLTGLSVTTVVAYRRTAGFPIMERRKTITKAKQQAAIHLLASGASISKACIASGMSASSMYRLLKMKPHIITQRNGIKNEKLKALHRADWLTVQLRRSTAGTTELRGIMPATYMWLYRYDKAWLTMNSPKRKPCERSQEFSRSKWNQLDSVLSPWIRSQVLQLMPLTASPRISRSMLLRWTRRPTTIRNNLHKLPKLARTIAEFSESQDDFRRRKLEHAKAKLQAAGDSNPPAWRILQLAGLRP